MIPIDATGYSITIDHEDKGAKINQELFGLFFEDINSAADGGLNPQLIKNNSFENYFNVQSIEEKGRGNQYSWKLHWVSSNAAQFMVEQDPDEYINENNTNYAAITGNMTLENGGFARMSTPNAASMGIVKGQAYDFYIWTKTEDYYEGTLKVQVVNANNEPLTEEKEVPLTKNGEWNKSETIVLTGTSTQKGKIRLTINGAADDDVLYLDMVSLSSQDTYGYGNKIFSYGLGVRKDLVEMLFDLNPSFIRFPGGCIIEGNSVRESYYNWEWSIVPLEERKAIANQWASDNGNYTNTYGYMQSFGFGYHEILQLCEDMGAEPFPILSAGVFCQFANGNNAPTASGEELDKFAQHATHLIDYCWGDPNSENKTQAEWASKRVENGHEAGGSDVFLGEYATHLDLRNNVLESAICDAAYMTGIERNGKHSQAQPVPIPSKTVK